MSLPRRSLAAVVVWSGFAVVSSAADEPGRKAAVGRQKEAVAVSLQRAGLGKLAHAETDDLLVYAAAPDGRVKSFADTLQKVYSFTRNHLKFEADDKPWPGKLTVVAVTDRRLYTAFIRTAEQRRAEGGESYSLAIRGDVPTVAAVAESGGKGSEADLLTEAGGVIAAAVLNKKAGTGTGGGTLPSWVEVGFGRAVVPRAEGNAAKLKAYRDKVRAAVLGTRTKPVVVRLADVWGDGSVPNADLVYASVVEYMAFGPEPDNFLRFAAAFKPTDERPSPTVASALETAGWKADALEAGWKRWLAAAK